MTTVCLRLEKLLSFEFSKILFLDKELAVAEAGGAAANGFAGGNERTIVVFTMQTTDSFRMTHAMRVYTLTKHNPRKSKFGFSSGCVFLFGVAGGFALLGSVSCVVK